MKEAPRKFLPLKAEPEPGDRLVAVPCYVLSANMAERGLLTRLTVKEVTAVVDAARGSAVIVDGAVEPREMPEIPDDIKSSPPASSPPRPRALRSPQSPRRRLAAGSAGCVIPSFSSSTAARTSPRCASI